jgi:signal transduction histidine kinase
MGMHRRSWWVYGLLLAVWAVVLSWQAAEHLRLRRYEQTKLIDRAKDISTTVGLVLRSQQHFGVISQERLESALSALIRPEALTAVALLNATGQVVASAGAPIDFELKGLVPSGEHWGSEAVTLMNLVDLGTNVTAETEGGRPTLVIPRSEMFSPFGTNRSGTNPPALGLPPQDGAEQAPDAEARQRRRPPPPDGPPELTSAGGTNATADLNNPARPRGRGWPRRGGDGRPPFSRPFWMTEEAYKAAIEKKGVHSFVMVLSTQSVNAATRQDLWLRLIIGVLTTVSVVGSGLAWGNLTKSSELQIRLVRASELNSHLREMNLAAAGLAHETRNPLNIIRGLAQMISKQPEAPEAIRKKSCEIVDETDRVTAQLNEFINYSRPREIRRTPLALPQVVAEVVRTLQSDLADKNIGLQVTGEPLTIEADEQSLRQVLFNLLLNATQAVAAGGEIRIGARKSGPDEALLEVCDNGPGVPAERRNEIFKPYFTTTQKGTGLGLAVVQQIVLAHGWDVACLPNEPHGAIFRITHLKLRV